MDFEPNAIDCHECGTRSYVDFANTDTECPVCLDNGEDDVWCHTVTMVVGCPKGDEGDGCESQHCNHRGEHSFDEYEWPDAVEGVDYLDKPAGLPKVCAKPCNECPWREVSAGGWLGPWTADEWVALANSDEPIACHTTIEVDSEWTARTRQCAGSASYRKSMGKLPRDPEVIVGPIHEGVFTNPIAFLEHHKIGADV